ncbi:MAG: transcriptional regulator, partial [Syntrophomonadaceae bacterium]|nr:transcriptional regulator [Syntrophomonadaceae bacterium]
TIILIGSDERLKLLEKIIDGQVITIEIGPSPLTEDKWVDPEGMKKILRTLKASRKI